MDDTAIQQFLKSRGVPLTNENLNMARQYAAQHPEIAEALALGLSKTNDNTNQTMEPAWKLEAPEARVPAASPMPQQPSAPAAQAPGKTSNGGQRPTAPRDRTGPLRSPFITSPIAPDGSAPRATLPSPAETGGGSDLLPWLLPILGIAAARSTQGNPSASRSGVPATTPEAGPRGYFAGRMNPENNPALTDESTRIILDPGQRQLGFEPQQKQLPAPEAKKAGKSGDIMKNILKRGPRG